MIRTLRGKPIMLAALLASSGLVLKPSDAVATRINIGDIIQEPVTNISYVRDANKHIAAIDLLYAVDLNNWPVMTNPMVDILMQQCFSGGFLDDIQGLKINHTFAASAAWNETAHNVQPNGMTLDNFTRAWIQDANSVPPTSVLTHFTRAAFVNPLIPKNPYSPPSIDPKRVDRPQYESPDVAPPAGANDSRTLTPPPEHKEFAILVAWGSARQQIRRKQI